MTTVVQPITSDGYNVEDSVTYNSGGATFLTVTGAGGGNARFSYIYFNRPFPLLTTIGPSFLRLYQRGAATGGSRTLTVRAVSASWKESTLNYTNRPTAVAGTSASVTLGDDATDGRVWEIDISALLQEVSDGQAWYGLRIESNNTTRISFHSSEADALQPEVEVSWSDAPQTPTVLAPSNGRAVSLARPTLRFDFTDHSGDVTMQGYRLLMNLGGPDEVSPDYDSGDVSASIPEHLVTFDIAAAANWYWAVETIDGAGLRSDLSDWTNFTRTAKPTVTIDSPSAGSVSDPTPPVLWTVTGGTQTAYQVFLTDPVDTATVLWTSNKVTSTDNGVTIAPADPSAPPLLSPGASYGLTVRIWDDVSRESTPGDPIYTDTSTTFTFDLSATVAPVSALTVVVVDGEPGATVNWTDATAPDSLTITVDGVTYATNIDPADALVSGTSYSWPLFGMTPRSEHEVSVLRVVNGETSDANPTATFTTEPKGVWLSTSDGAYSVCIGGESPRSANANELVAVRKPIGEGVNPVIIRQTTYGPEGEVSGDLVEVPGKSLAQMAADWAAMTARDRIGQTMQLVDMDIAMRVQIYNAVRGSVAEFPPSIPVKFSYFELL